MEGSRVDAARWIGDGVEERTRSGGLGYASSSFWFEVRNFAVAGEVELARSGRNMTGGEK